MRYRHWLASTLLLAASIPLAAQIPDPTDQARPDRFYIDVAGHALFPHAPPSQGDTLEPTPGFKTGGGVTTAFGYHIRAGFSTEAAISRADLIRPQWCGSPRHVAISSRSILVRAESRINWLREGRTMS